MTTIVDYGAGNLRSVQNTLDELGAAYRVTNRPEDVETADKLVDSLATQGQEAVQAMLLPLLDNESPQVRYAAAGHLLHHGAADRATDVLQALVDDPNSGVRGLAFALLRTWQRQNH